ncbi:MAG: phosphodiester glycosidase family protein [Clostridia bacterium]|nr:phosphodiester glycosidase family protein [Clostridia bacterium]
MKERKPALHPLAAIAIDIAVIGVLLGSFYYLNFLKDAEPIDPVQLPTLSPYVEPTATADLTTPNPSDITPTPDPTENPQYAGMFGEAVGDMLLAIGETPIVTENSYKSENISFTITQVQENGITYFLTDIYIRELSCLRTAFASGSFAEYSPKWVYEIAEDNNALVAFSGDYCQFGNQGLVIRNGVLYREVLSDTDVAVLYNDGTLAVYGPDELDLDYIKTHGAYQAWCFGPSLLTESGEAKTTFNSTLMRANPRVAIGYYEPGHYCMLVVDGRQAGYSDGMTLSDMSILFYELGCKVAYNLDGGVSATMAYNGTMYNNPPEDVRRVGDIIYFCEPDA